MAETVTVTKLSENGILVKAPTREAANAALGTPVKHGKIMGQMLRGERPLGAVITKFDEAR